MLRKSILIGLFVLNNNRGGYERQLSSHAFLRPVTAGTGNWGGFSLAGYGRHGSQWVYNVYFIGKTRPLLSLGCWSFAVSESL